MGRHRIHEIGEALELLRGDAALNIWNGRPAGVSFWLGLGP
ncbi:hypothetical protein OG585_48115 (plasmid) [Streptomyces sp. NBC_01340]|nr:MULTISPECIES: hypothetical protein [unclassified Streptomyces]WSI44789.1 hypothetical protein OG585_48115 [Streptomyces sp. NBC_01340]